ncbi:TPA: phage tail protein [Vibrio cholerae]|nr:phage tail protein [Vibrio cholerae]
MTNLVPESEQQYGSILTVLGENAEQNGKLLNKQIVFTHIAFGDANDTYVQPDRKAQGLVNELHRIPVNSVDVLQATPDSVPILKVEAILPDDVNDVVIREFAAVATFNGQSYFHAIGNCARVYVPRPINNGNVSNPVTLEMTFVITSAEPIVEIDPNVVTASREYVNAVALKRQESTTSKQLSVSSKGPFTNPIKDHQYLWIDNHILASFNVQPPNPSLIKSINLDDGVVTLIDDTEIGITVQNQVGSALALKSLNGRSGQIVRTLGYYGGFLGSACYKHFEPEDIVDFQKAKDIADEIGGGFTQPGGGVWILIPEGGGIVNPYQFGILFDNDGNSGVGHDNHENLQAMINYCAPFVWKGSVSETKKYMGQVRAKVEGGFGRARYTGSLLLNPFFSWEGFTVGGFFEKEGTVLVSDFDSNSNFAMDAAPYNQDGERPLGMIYNRHDFDGGRVTGSPGQSIKGIKLIPASGRNIRGGINRSASQQSFFQNNSIVGFDVGLQNSCAWAGSIRYNHIRSKAIGIYNGNDSTVEEQEYNYITAINSPSADFKWPVSAIPDDLAHKTTGIWNRFSAISPKNNVIESFDHMFKGEGNDVRNLDSNYSEKIKEFIYVIYGSKKTRIVTDNLRSPGANLLHITGPDYATCDIDISATQLVDLSGWGVINISKINITGLDGTEPGLKNFNEKVNLVDRQGSKKIHVSPSGSDSNWGFKNCPVYTLQGALERISDGDSATIIIEDGAEITTKYGFKGGNVSDKYLDNVNITIKSNTSASVNFGESFGEVHALPLSDSKVRWQNVSLKAAALLNNSNEMRQCHRFYGVCSLNLMECVAVKVTVAGVRTKASATVSIESYKTHFIDSELTQGNMMWTENNAESIFDNTVQGRGSIKIRSKQYP